MKAVDLHREGTVEEKGRPVNVTPREAGSSEKRREPEGVESFKRLLETRSPFGHSFLKLFQT